MYRLAVLGLLTTVAFAQEDPFKPKAPVEVDKALHERVMEFFDLHVKGQFRKAEEMVAEDTKEFFYSGNKPRYIGCEFSKVDYTDNFTKAKVVTICEQYVMMPGFTDKPLKVPTPSTWKIENGKWVWYVDQDALLNTPWGRMKPGAFPDKGAPPPPPNLASISMSPDFLFTQVQLERNEVSLKPGEKAEIQIANSAPGVMTLVLPSGNPKEIEAKLDTLNVPAKGRATLTLTAGPGAKSGIVNVQVDQTSQMLPVKVTVLPGSEDVSLANPGPGASVIKMPLSNPLEVGALAKPLQFDKKAVRLKVGQSAVIQVTNPGAAETALSIASPAPAGIEAKFDPAKVAAGGKAKLTLRAAKGARSGVVNVRGGDDTQPIQVTIVK